MKRLLKHFWRLVGLVWPAPLITTVFSVLLANVVKQASPCSSVCAEALASLLLIFIVPVGLHFWSALFYGENSVPSHLLRWQLQVLAWLAPLHFPLLSWVVYLYWEWPWLIGALALASLVWVLLAYLVGVMAISNTWL
jgi:hypothetical protein